VKVRTSLVGLNVDAASNAGTFCLVDVKRVRLDRQILLNLQLFM